VLQAGVRWKWIEENAALGIKNPQPPMGEIDPFEDWAEIEAIAAELDSPHRGAPEVVSCSAHDGRLDRARLGACREPWGTGRAPGVGAVPAHLGLLASWR
jgi:hypothetical protein